MVKLSDPQHLRIPCYADAKMIILSSVSECMNHSFSMYAKLSKKLTFRITSNAKKYVRIIDKKC